MDYTVMRHFADSWGLVYLFGIFILVAGFLLRPGAREQAKDAARIPLQNDEGNGPR
ncbi:MAG: cbb3-type cytochrome c oxidase subunit 3 [Candidatus Devosia phytovorans]|uniref:Cbb3-type cytochrome c oxidase subunit 3 n=1 Tax=Candidatus Devosia phytovorans TaxID=3121372 RepID=A0AAJ6B3P6_9HYPH|nr:cbb3-type cytochrome c oxidase subunit 3 [Devosia sp.]WEK06668.1 MAG: cbb3-type cytochrome c oxidase subunit 3 [Devosia sp.]